MTRKNSGRDMMTRLEKDSKERRAKMLALVDQGKPMQEIADIFGCSKQRIGILVQRARVEAGRPRVTR